MENQLTRNAFNLDFRREVDVAPCILRFSVLKKIRILKSYTKIHTADLQLASRSACRAYQTQCNWLHDRHAGHVKPSATGFTIGMPGMPNPMQLASRSACRACQTQYNWLHDRHAGHVKPSATGFTIGMPGMPNPMQLASRSACRACQTGRADRRVTSKNPRKNCGTHFGSSSLLVTKVANGKVYLPEISVCNTNLRRRLKLKN